MIFVFDASALIAFLTGESGAAVVEQLLLDNSNRHFIHAVNLYEMYRHIDSQDGSLAARRAVGKLESTGFSIREDLDLPFLIKAAELRKANRMSMADTFGLVLAVRLDAEFVTADHHELDPVSRSGTVRIRFFR